ncbi:ABC transporter ATP-binding protein [Phreatobacter stygius]|uniref:Dipeptide ABC transporter ATP-binding protein n=1 Tax=Phreatobacter stygius TaxID=1940610 RepID=A0A4D7B052_9HYPH|nr:dipeptide ABC transporter ATP-binding protein [Phreatobacter stygius]QCI64218.1 dipeptide ABC transporter ATP-binding protein [Phreatobacter stygius]
MTVLLETRDLIKQFPARTSAFGRVLSKVHAVDGVSLSIAAGETLALVGESGCGKSTVGRLVLRLIEATGGQVTFDGDDLATLGQTALREKRRHAQLIFQDPFASLNPRMTVGDILAEPLMLHRIVPASARAQRVGELLAEVGLQPHQALRYPHEFSGGQRQRIAIARAIAVEPKLIVCDEPVSALDVSIRAQILNLLRDLQRRRGLALLFISHDLAVVKHIADRIAVMYLGRIVETAPTDTLFAEPRHPYTRALLSAIPVAAPGVARDRQLLEGDVPSPLNPPPGCHLNTRCPFVIERCRSERPALIGDSHATACHRWPDLPPAGDIVPREAIADLRLERLIAAFAREPESAG